MVWGALIGAVGSLAAGALGSKGAGDAADAQMGAANAAAGVQRDIYNQTREDLNPYRYTGEQANSLLRSTLNGNAAAFQKSPGYQFAFDEGMRALDSSGAARGMTLSGAQVKAANRYGQGIANQEYNNWFSRMSNLSGMGQNAATQTGAFGQNMAGNVGNALMASGAAQGTGYINKANAYGNALSGLVDATGEYLGGRRSGYTNSVSNAYGADDYLNDMRLGGAKF